MKSSPVLLLLYGRDNDVLEPRKWVLQTRGYQVAQATAPGEVDRIPAKSVVELVILCHPLTKVEIQAIEQKVQARWPGAKRLVLGATDSRYPTGMLGGLLYTMDGPGKLLMMVKEMLEPQMPLAEGEPATSLAS